MPRDDGIYFQYLKDIYNIMSNHGLVQQGTAASADMVNVLLPRNTQTTHKIGVSFPKRIIASDICDFTQSYNKKIYYCPVKPRNTKHNRVWSSSILFYGIIE